MTERFAGHGDLALRQTLANGITILERLGIIDFNGHVSARLDDGNVIINTGSSVRSAISADDFVTVDPEGNFADSAPSPPKELALHLAIYRARKDIKSVVHGHPMWSTLLSSAGRAYEVTMAQGALLGDIPQYPSPRSVNNRTIADEVAGVLGNGKAALLRAHGSVVAAGDPIEAVVLGIYLELNAERQVRGAPLGGSYRFTTEEIAACRRGLSSRGLIEKCWNYYAAKTCSKPLAISPGVSL